MKYIYKKKIYILMFTILDAIGRVLLYPLRMFAKDDSVCPKSIIVIRGDHIGDVVASSVVLGPLREAFPKAKIDMMVPSGTADVFKENPYLDNTILFDPPWFDRQKSGIGGYIKGLIRMKRLLKSGNYDVAIGLRGDSRHIFAMFLGGIKHRISYGITGGGFLLSQEVSYQTKMHETDRNMALLEPLGIKRKASDVCLNFSKKDREEATCLMKDCDIAEKYAILHVVPGHCTKLWSPDKFARVAEYVRQEKRLIPIIIGASADTCKIAEIIKCSKVKIVDISGKTRLGLLGPILENANLFVGLDSGPSHIASAVGVPVVILFSGVNDPDEWAPRGRNVSVVYPGQGENLSVVTPEEVCRAVDEALEKQS